nr:hypothetical protein [Tanacetum cinerariifolium]
QTPPPRDESFDSDSEPEAEDADDEPEAKDANDELEDHATKTYVGSAYARDHPRPVC